MKTERILKTLKTNSEKVIEVTLRYSKGGYSYFTYQNQPRGYYLGATPVEYSTGNGYTSKSFMMFSGVKTLVKEAARFSQKTLDTLVVPDEEIKKLAEHVAAKSNLALAAE